MKIRLTTGRGRDLVLALIGGAIGASVAVVATDLPAALPWRQPPAVVAGGDTLSTSTRTATGAVAASPPSVPGLPVTGSFSAPVEIVIPAIKLDARIESVGQDTAGAMGVPKDIHDAAWYQNGPAPGDPGDAVIDGHLDWYTGPAVFWNLGRLKPGDAIAVTLSNGTRVNFSTVATATYPYVSRVPGLFATSGRPELSLITCAGKWDAQAHLYLSRLVVSATVVGT